SLESVQLPQNLRSIGFFAFQNCTSLTSITLPGSIRRIEGLAFCDCSALNEICYVGTKQAWSAVYKGDSWNKGIPNASITYLPSTQ
ncbi:MAG: leucine-rich repeat protein, partial [Clostridia bacterium]|nr:leucine-rich repeat protein [Clostridia bacterium]